ncbi:MAG TPA: ATP-binding cassette domain-containing protein [Bacteroidia bacterium]|jgi:ABC-type multidrug transport system ATPase subunit|nr:ATP-binding cassette domain-containing protein [Bacteroidia bacterium]
MSKVLTIDSVMLEFGTKKVLSDIFMEFETGKVTGILGRNGAGKSSLMKIIFGTLHVEGKSIRVAEKRMHKPYLEKGTIAFLPQDDFVPGYIKLKTALHIYGINTDKLLADFPHFAQLMDTKMKNLSGGERRLAETYLVMSRDVSFVLLDEPFSYLAPIYVQKLKEIMQVEKGRKGIIITDHMYRDVKDISDKLYLLNDGKNYKIENENQLVELGYLNKPELKNPL